jgi:hypothetical protein
MKNKLFGTLFLTLLFSTSGCQWGWGKRAGHAGGTPYTSLHGAFTICLPTGWTSIETPPGRVMATINDFRLQRIIVKYTNLEEPLPYSKRRLEPGISSSELADALIKDLRGDETVTDLTVLERGPASIAGDSGCKVIVRFNNSELGNTEMIKMFYSCIHESCLYMLIYDARVGHYCDHGLAGFEETVNSFQFGKP